jgi:hypothetical protein
MPARAKLIESETNNRIKLITADQIVSAINSLSNAEKKAIVLDILNNDGNMRSILADKLRQIIRQQVVIDVDAYIATGSVPIAFLDNNLN